MTRVKPIAAISLACAGLLAWGPPGAAAAPTLMAAFNAHAPRAFVHPAGQACVTVCERYAPCQPRAATLCCKAWAVQCGQGGKKAGERARP